VWLKRARSESSSLYHSRQCASVLKHRIVRIHRCLLYDARLQVKIVKTVGLPVRVECGLNFKSLYTPGAERITWSRRFLRLIRFVLFTSTSQSDTLRGLAH